MRRVTQVVVACLGLAPGPALAWDWSLSSTMSQTFELNDNQFMRNMLAGGTLGSYTTVTANAVALTPTSKLTVDADVGYTKYWGPGTEGIAQTESDRIGITTHYVTWGKNQDDTDFLDGSFRRSSTLVAVLGDLGLLTNVQGDIDRTMLGGGIPAKPIGAGYDFIFGQLGGNDLRSIKQRNAVYRLDRDGQLAPSG